MGTKILYKYILIGLIVSAVTYLITKPLLYVPESILILDSILSGAILSCLIFILKYIGEFSKTSSLSYNQQIINYSALAIVFVFCWLGIEYCTLYFFTKYSDFFVPLIPIRTIIAVLLYCVVVARISDYGNAEQTDFEEEPQEVTESNNIVERITVKNGNKIDVVMVSDIVHLQAEGDYVMIFSLKGKYLKEQTMKFFQEILPPDKFIRVHRSDIINIEYISQIEQYNKQSHLLKLKNGNQVKVSLGGFKILKDALGL